LTLHEPVGSVGATGGAGRCEIHPRRPAGLDLSLKHESQVTEAGQPRKVFMEIKAVVIGEITQRLVGLEIGSSRHLCRLSGTNQRNGRGTVLHVTEFE
jgi:primosomal replication protein N